MTHLQEQRQNTVIFMDINREAAMQLWERDHNKAQEAQDFSGRLMKKAAYGQRGSKFGWNIDHILPKSQGGKNNQDNLICTHIDTNDEKADNFPVFKANGKTFQIVKKNGKWSIEEVSAANNDKSRAVMHWNRIFGKDAATAKDFSGRIIKKTAYRKSAEQGGWDTDKFIKEKEADEGNIYIANSLTISERKQRPNFSANKINWSVRQSNGSYNFKNNDVIDREDMFEPGNVKKIIAESKRNQGKLWMNYIVIKVSPGYNSGKISVLNDALQDIVNIYNAPSFIYTDLDKNLIVFEYHTGTKSEMQKVFNTSVLLCTYIPLLKSEFKLSGITILNMSCELDQNTASLGYIDVVKQNPVFKVMHDSFMSQNNRYYATKYSEDNLYISSVVANNISENIKGFTKDKFNATDILHADYIYVETKNKINNLIN